MLKVLLFALLIYVVNMVHYQPNTGIPGLAPVNVLFLLVLLAMLGKPEVMPSPAALRVPLVVFGVGLILGFVWAQLRAPRDFIDDATYLKNALFYPIFYFVYRNCKLDPKGTRQLIICVLVVAAVAGLEAIREGIDYGFDAYNPTRRASGPFGVDWRNSNRAGVFYAMFMPMFVSMALNLQRQKFWRLAALGGCVLLAGGALFTYSRQSYFMVLLAIAILVIKRSIVLSVVIAIGMVSIVGYLPESATQRVDETNQETQSGEVEVDASTASRWEIWGGALKMLANNPLGVGLNRFKGEIGKYSSHKGMDAHNFYVLTLAECGPHGLAGLLFLIYGCFRFAAYLRGRAPPGDSEAQALSLGFLVCTLNMALAGVYGSPTLEGAVMAPYWALCGLLERYLFFKNLAIEPAGAATPADSLALRFPLATHIAPGRRE